MTSIYSLANESQGSSFRKYFLLGTAVLLFVLFFLEDDMVSLLESVDSSEAFARPEPANDRVLPPPHQLPPHEEARAVETPKPLVVADASGSAVASAPETVEVPPKGRQSEEAPSPIVLSLPPSATAESLSFFDMGALRAAKVVKKPFRHVFVEQFVTAEALAAINADFPPSLAHSTHVDEWQLVQAGEIRGAYKELLDQVRSDAFVRAFEKVFKLDGKLGESNVGRRVSMRGMSVKEDGRIHKDLKLKLVTVLIYLNPEQLAGADPDAGHLRLLRTRNYEDHFFIAQSWHGNMLAFVNPQETQRAGFHGYSQYIGPRRAIQLNYQVGWVAGVKAPEGGGGKKGKQARKKSAKENQDKDEGEGEEKGGRRLMFHSARRVLV